MFRLINRLGLLRGALGHLIDDVVVLIEVRVLWTFLMFKIMLLIVLFSDFSVHEGIYLMRITLSQL